MSEVTSMSPALIWDIALVVLIAIIAVVSAYRGFVATLLRLAGTVGSLIVAALVSKKGATWIYDSYLADRIASAISEKLAAKLATLSELVSNIKILPFLEGKSIAGVLSQTDIVKSIENTANMAAVRSLMISLLGIIVFIGVFIICQLLIKLLAKLAKNVNEVPVLGGTNRIFGFVLGVAEGLVICYVIGLAATLLVSLSQNHWTWLNTDVVESTKLLKFLINLKF